MRRAARGVTTLAEALEDTPGLGVVQAGGIGQQTSLFAGGANSYHTLVLFDGMRINDPSTPNSSFDAGQDQLNGLSRIEVVEGPMSAVFGSDAIGGVVNMIPRRGGDGALNARLDMSARFVRHARRDRAASTARSAASAMRSPAKASPPRATTSCLSAWPRTPAMRTARNPPPSPAFSTCSLRRHFSLDLLARHREARADYRRVRSSSSPPRSTNIAPIRPTPRSRRTTSPLARLGATWALERRALAARHRRRLEQERERTCGGAHRRASKANAASPI